MEFDNIKDSNATLMPPSAIKKYLEYNMLSHQPEHAVFKNPIYWVFHLKCCGDRLTYDICF
jgi:hypothetical protein